MGFYGNITNVNKSTFQFDKIYYTAAEMMENATSDGIFVGRYVLVDYDEAISKTTVLDALKRDAGLLDEWSQSTIIPGYKRLIYVEDSETSQGRYWDGAIEGVITNGENFGFYPGKPLVIEGETSDQLYSEDDLKDLNNKFILVLGHTEERYKTSTTDPAEIEGLTIEKFEYSTNPELWQISVTELESESEENEEEGTTPQPHYLITFTRLNEQTTYEKYRELILNADISNNYAANYETDRAYFAEKSGGQGIGRGYDSTVWQKVIRDGQMSYVMIAELNSVVPTFDVTVDAPTETPRAPYYDTDTSNLYYNLHVQPSWGMKVKDVEEGPSDLNGKAIYWNEDGFNKYISSINNEVDNQISVNPTGISGNKYWKGNGRFDTAPDTYEISIMLPEIGNIMSEIWDMIYGGEHQIDTLGHALWNGNEYSTASKKFRNTNFQWDTHNGERMLVARNPETDEPYSGYNKDALNTLVGTINSAHDLMGMIVVDFVPKQKDNETDEAYATTLEQFYQTLDIDSLDPNNIYYDSHKNKYYYKEKKYLFDDLENVGIQSNEFVDPTVTNVWRLKKFDFNDLNTGETLHGQDYYLVGDDPIVEGEVYGTIVVSEPNPKLSPNNYDPESNNTDDWVWTYDEKKYTFNRKTGELSPDDSGYYNLLNIDQVKGTDVSKEKWPQLYVANKYYLGLKEFGTPEEARTWSSELDGRTPIDEEHPQTIFETDFDSISLRRESTIEAVKKAAGILTDDNGTNQWVPNNNIGYKFLLGITIDQRESTYSLVDANAVDEALTEVDGIYLKKNAETGVYTYKFANQEEILKNCKIGTPVDPVSGDPIETQNEWIYYLASQYRSNIDGNNDLKTLQGWKTFLNGNDTNLKLTLEEKLVPELVKPAYSLTNAKIVNPKDLSDESVNYYIADHWNDQNNPTMKFEKLDYDSIVKFYNGESGQADGDWFTFEPTDAFIYYSLTNPYYKNVHNTITNEGTENETITPDGNIWNRITIPTLAGYEGAKFLREVEFTPKKVFIPDTYYYISNGEYVLAHQLEANKIYYKYVDFFVEHDDNGIYADGAYWNLAVDPVPAGITIGAKTYEWELHELPGFADRLNTMHGLILKINRLLSEDVENNRDRATVQGAINTLNDIINKFNELKPAEIVMVDGYGRVHSAKIESEQKFSTAVGTAPAIPSGETDATDDGRWIKITTTSGLKYELVTGERPNEDTTTYYKLENGAYVAYEEEDLADWAILVANNAIYKEIKEENCKPHIKVEHMFNAGTDDLITTNLNIDNVASSNNSDKITLYKPILDNMGHVVAKQENTVTLPYGFKTITGNNGSLVADNTQDTAAFNGDTWIQTTASASGVSFTHIGPGTVAERTVNDLAPAFGSSFTIEDWRFDDKGHKAGLQTHTVTIPQGSLSDAAANGADVITQLSFTPNSGALSTTRTNIGALKLTGLTGTEYNASTNNVPTATDTLNQALDKIMGILDNSVTSVNSRINALDADLDASGTAQHSGVFVVSGVTEANGKITAIDSVEVDPAGAAAGVLGSSTDTASANTVYGAKAYAKDYVDGLASNYEPAGTVSTTLTNISYTPYTYDGTNYTAGTVTTKTLAQLVEIIAKLDAKLTYLENNNI